MGVLHPDLTLPTSARMLAIVMALAGITFFTAMVDIQQAAALKCAKKQDGDIEDKSFDPGESGITSAKLHCSEGEPMYCDFGKDSNGKYVRPPLTNGWPCGLDNKFWCSCSLVGALYDEFNPTVRPMVPTTVSCGKVKEGDVSTTVASRGSGVKEASLHCAKRMPEYCRYKYAIGSSNKLLAEALAYYGKDPEPCGRNNEYLCYCEKDDASAIFRVRKNRKLIKNDS